MMPKRREHHDVEAIGEETLELHLNFIYMLTCKKFWEPCEKVEEKKI